MVSSEARAWGDVAHMARFGCLCVVPWELGGGGVFACSSVCVCVLCGCTCVPWLLQLIAARPHGCVIRSLEARLVWLFGISTRSSRGRGVLARPHDAQHHTCTKRQLQKAVGLSVCVAFLVAAQPWMQALSASLYRSPAVTGQGGTLALGKYTVRTPNHSLCVMCVCVCVVRRETRVCGCDVGDWSTMRR